MENEQNPDLPAVPPPAAPVQQPMQAQPVAPMEGYPAQGTAPIVPGQQPIQQVVVNNNSGSNIVGFKGPNHVLHLILTIVTVGLWLPVWIVIALRNKQKPQYG